MELSSTETTRIMYSDKKLHIDELLTRSEFDNFIATDLEKISVSIKKTITDASIETNSIDKVLLTGGTSFVPAVRKLFVDTFGEDKLVNLDAFTSVAHGLALSASFH